MSRQQFRILIVVEQLLVFAILLVRGVTDQMIPPELKDYLGISQSVLSAQIGNDYFYNDALYLIDKVLMLVGLIGAVGLCSGRRWGRTLFLFRYVASLLTAPLIDFSFDTGWTVMVGYLASTLEGMILALAYFSHLRRMFERPKRVEQSPLSE